MEAVSSDQLARLFRGLMSDKGNHIKRSLIYLTAHRTLPIEDITDGSKEIDDSSDTYEYNVYWLSWFEVYKTISGLLKEDSRIQDKYWRIVLCDIQRLLHRKGLRQFEGFEGITDEYEAIATFYPTDQPIFYRPKRGSIMNNEVKTQENLSACIKNSFDIVARVYEESSFLLKDLAEELEKMGFEKLQGNEIGTETSRLIDKWKKWLPRYASFFFKSKDELDSKRLLSITAIYFDIDLKVVKPYFIIGVSEMFDGGKWDYWWMDAAFFNRDDMFRYYGKDNEALCIESPRQNWQSKEDEWGFKVPNERSTSYPKAGKLFAIPLLEINNIEDIKKLACRGSKLWNTKFTWDTDDQ